MILRSFGCPLERIVRRVFAASLNFKSEIIDYLKGGKLREQTMLSVIELPASMLRQYLETLLGCFRAW